MSLSYRWLLDSTCSRIPLLFMLLFVLSIIPYVANASGAADALGTDSTSVISSPITNYSGVYRGESGAILNLSRVGKSPEWIMTVDEPGSSPLTVVLYGKESLLKPSGMNGSINFDGKPMDIVVSDDRVYAQGMSEGKTIECLRDSKGTRTALDGDRSKNGETSPCEMESSMMLDEVAGRWESVKQIEIGVNKGGLTLRSSANARSVRKFVRERNFSDDEAELMKQKLAAHTRILSESDTFVAREKKSGEKQ